MTTSLFLVDRFSFGASIVHALSKRLDFTEILQILVVRRRSKTLTYEKLQFVALFFAKFLRIKGGLKNSPEIIM